MKVKRVRHSLLMSGTSTVMRQVKSHCSSRSAGFMAVNSYNRDKVGTESSKGEKIDPVSR